MSASAKRVSHVVRMLRCFGTGSTTITMASPRTTRNPGSSFVVARIILAAQLTATITLAALSGSSPMEPWMADIILSCLAVIFAGGMGFVLGMHGERDVWESRVRRGDIPKSIRERVSG